MIKHFLSFFAALFLLFFNEKPQTTTMGLHDEQRIKKLLTTMKIEKHLLEDQEVHQEKGGVNIW